VAGSDPAAKGAGDGDWTRGAGEGLYGGRSHVEIAARLGHGRWVVNWKRHAGDILSCFWHDSLMIVFLSNTSTNARALPRVLKFYFSMHIYNS
jgi:hypothetical protein